MLYLEHFLLTEVNETNVYLAACTQAGQAALFDAGGFERQVLERTREKGFEVRYIFITHNHYDHTGGLEEYMGAYPRCRVVSAGAVCGGSAADDAQDGRTFPLGELAIEARRVPGHTDDSTGYVLSPVSESARCKIDRQVLFSGDALFAGSVGGTFGADSHDKEIAGIREQFLSLPESTIVCPGHGPCTTIGIEKRYNPFLGAP